MVWAGLVLISSENSRGKDKIIDFIKDGMADFSKSVIGRQKTRSSFLYLILYNHVTLVIIY